ncbi:PREDICTED: bZIP transcription factor 16-like isoform X2 [Camelina sativa]|uniref:BZIP transcription factor 16-like isoform X2 n=1 Tax=Camelina sativa TaxID=90675 RepID=A0ABM1RQL6_CAMSA|nr:PREDICTED: bZIP transcription factor 16-like isoform X2 [Camelina sativa]
MASSENLEKSSKEKEPKTPPSSSAALPSSQEPSSAVSAGMATPDWSGFQAYSPMPPPHGYVASSPQPHPYMWGVQVACMRILQCLNYESGSGQDGKDASENGGSANGPGNGSPGTPLLPVNQTVPSCQ